MSVRISVDHPTLALKTKIQQVGNEFLKTFGFNYFQYLRCFADGSISALVNHTGLLEYFQHVDNAPIVFSSFNDKYENAHTYWFLWDEELPEFPVRLAREKFNIHNGLTLVRRTKAYYDMIAVALPQTHPNPGGFYLNKLKGIEQFIMEFEKDNKDLITIMNKNPISLPEAYRDVNYKDMCLNRGKIVVNGKYGKSYITTQELACMQLLSQGSSHKIIAQILEISPRTVETYFARIKDRTGAISRQDIEHILSQGTIV